MSLEGKVALVTGAARGIGGAIAHRLAREGASVLVCDQNLEGAERVAREIQTEGGEAQAFFLDVVSQKLVDTTMEEVMEKYGRIDILVNNAGITRDNLLLRMKEEEWNDVLSVNLVGVYHCTRAVLKPLLKGRWGRIINIASVIGLIGNPGQANYAASKAGVIGFTKSVAREVATRGITANAVAPGFITTQMTEGLSQELRERVLAQIPLGRMGTPQEVAAVVAFLASEEASYLTGQVINVDGGMVM